MPELKKYPEIGQFRTVVKNIRSEHDFQGLDEDGKAIFRHETPYPTLKFQGTVKLHGTNGAIGITRDGEIWTQSRRRMLATIKHSTNDNAGFAHFVAGLPEDVKGALNQYTNTVFYGEWCGGSIQRSVALNKLENMFVIFDAKVLDNGNGEEIWHRGICDELVEYCAEYLNKSGVYDISQFPTYEIDIDFNYPELSQNKLSELTKAVGDECPVAKHFGVSGVGEGIVWKCISDNSDYDNSGYWFKVKDERHSVSKVKTLAPVDPEKVKSIHEFIDKTVTTNRLNQGVDVMKEMQLPLEMKSTGNFIKWVVNDIIKEETDVLDVSGLTIKDVGKYISTRAREFWAKRIDEEVL